MLNILHQVLFSARAKRAVLTLALATGVFALHVQAADLPPQSATVVDGEAEEAEVGDAEVGSSEVRKVEFSTGDLDDTVAPQQGKPGKWGG